MGLPREEELAQSYVVEGSLLPLGVISVPGLANCSLSCSVAWDWLSSILSKGVRPQVGLLLPLQCFETPFQWETKKPGNEEEGERGRKEISLSSGGKNDLHLLNTIDTPHPPCISREDPLFLIWPPKSDLNKLNPINPNAETASESGCPVLGTPIVLKMISREQGILLQRSQGKMQSRIASHLGSSIKGVMVGQREVPRGILPNGKEQRARICTLNPALFSSK